MKDVNITYISSYGDTITFNTGLIDEDVLRAQMGLEPHEQYFKVEEG